jgi:predicted acylesterase/phospholipase RssA
MKPFRAHVGIAIDGGGIRGALVARALEMLEDHLGRSCHEVFQLAAGTSTGSILSAGIAVGLSGAGMHRLYRELGATIFRRTWRSWLWPLTRYRYPLAPLNEALRRYLGDRTMGDLWRNSRPTDLVITAFDLATNHTCLVKPWKPEYATWPIVQAVLASSSVPTYFPVVEGRYVDGGVGAYANPCYVAAYEARFCLGWDPAETTIISLGTGRPPHTYRPGDGSRFWAWDWIGPITDAFMRSADDQQVHLVDAFFAPLDFRRFQVDLREPIAMDDPTKMDRLTAYGEELGRKILNDQTDPIPEVKAGTPATRW